GLGPWPVAPANITTRDDVIRAFEYLSLLWLGPPARNWNHEVIAGHLGEEHKVEAGPPALMTWDPLAQRRAADELAALYERARYAPPGDPLPADALAVARRDLCFLPGMPAS